MKTNKFWNRTDIASGIGMSACGRTATSPIAANTGGVRIAAAGQRKTEGHVGLPVATPTVAFTTVPGANAWSPPGC